MANAGRSGGGTFDGNSHGFSHVIGFWQRLPVLNSILGSEKYLTEDLKNMSINIFKNEQQKCSNFEIQLRTRYTVKGHDAWQKLPTPPQNTKWDITTDDLWNLLFRFEILPKPPPPRCFSTSSKWSQKWKYTQIPPYFDISNLNKSLVPHGGLKLDKV